MTSLPILTTNEVTISGVCSASITAIFNRGLISTQHVSEALKCQLDQPVGDYRSSREPAEDGLGRQLPVVPSVPTPILLDCSNFVVVAYTNQVKTGMNASSRADCKRLENDSSSERNEGLFEYTLLPLSRISEMSGRPCRLEPQTSTKTLSLDWCNSSLFVTNCDLIFR
jgi:hypothetical protein